MATARNRLEPPGTDRPPGTVHNFFMISMNFHVFLRFSLKFHEFKWTFMFFDVFLDGFHEVSCVFMKLHVLFVCFGDVWCVLMFFQEFSWILMRFHVFLRNFSLFFHEISSLLVLFVRFSMICHIFQCFVNIFKNLHVLSRFFFSEILKKFQFHEFQRICMLFMFYSCFLQREYWQKPNGGIAFYSQNPCRNLRGALLFTNWIPVKT